jgi:hypothetical protein
MKDIGFPEPPPRDELHPSGSSFCNEILKKKTKAKGQQGLYMEGKLCTMNKCVCGLYSTLSFPLTRFVGFPQFQTQPQPINPSRSLCVE